MRLNHVTSRYPYFSKKAQKIKIKKSKESGSIVMMADVTKKSLDFATAENNYSWLSKTFPNHVEKGIFSPDFPDL